FHLRTGVRFHDGERFTAAAVVASWARTLRAGRARGGVPAGYLELIDGAEAYAREQRRAIDGLTAVDDSTLDVALREPVASFPAMLARMTTAIDARTSRPDRPIGTGPWRWVSGAASDSVIVFARSGEYWGDAARMDSAKVRVVRDAHAPEAIATGVVDCLSTSSRRLVRRLSVRSDLRLSSSPAVGLRRLIVNFRRPLLADVRVREALQVAVDVPTLARVLDYRDVDLSGNLLPPGSLGHERGHTPRTYSPERARQLMVAGGYDPRDTIVMWTTTASRDDSLRSEVYLVRDYWRAAGFSVRVLAEDGDYDRVLSGQVDITSMINHPRYPDPDALLFDRYHSSGTATANVGAFRDVRIDSLLMATRRVVDSTRRARSVRTAVAAIDSAVPSVVLWNQALTTASSLRVVGCPSNVYSQNYTTVRPADAARGRRG
ncbi:MAG: ABC transporter substrate-binding protein, partial [Gemmatimonadaceae bacterium]|nr:ABC transporter substrate-binding protein [Gemmatimonadaceae bacterium]